MENFVFPDEIEYNTNKCQCTIFQKFFSDNRTYYAKRRNSIKVSSVKRKPRESQLLSRHLTLLSNVCGLSWYLQS